jgi:hypothetical protein
MFGHQDDLTQQPTNQISDQSIDGAMGGDTGQPVTPPQQPIVAPSNPADGSDNSNWQHPGVPLGVPLETDSLPAVTSSSSPAPIPVDNDADNDNGDNANDLIDIKQQALNQLSPLVGHLDQTPEEKFRTTMMMIQASDNQSLIKSAFEAAQSISDEKERAQALLDIVNEINYFTQQHSQN